MSEVRAGTKRSPRLDRSQTLTCCGMVAQNDGRSHFPADSKIRFSEDKEFMWSYQNIPNRVFLASLKPGSKSNRLLLRAWKWSLVPLTEMALPLYTKNKMKLKKKKQSPPLFSWIIKKFLPGNVWSPFSGWSLALTYFPWLYLLPDFWLLVLALLEHIPLSAANLNLLNRTAMCAVLQACLGFTFRKISDAPHPSPFADGCLAMIPRLVSKFYNKAMAWTQPSESLGYKPTPTHTAQ